MSSPTKTPLHALPLALVAACLVAMGCSASPPVALTGAPVPTGDMAGQVVLPVDVVGEAAVIPTGIGRVIPTGVGRVIPTGVGRYRVSNSVGRYRVSNSVGRYRVQGLGEELPVTGALVMAFDAETHQALPNVAPATTDERGGFTLHGVPARPVVIEAIATVGADEFHLLAFGQGASTSLSVSWRSTAVVEPLLERPDTRWSALDADALHREEATVATQAEGLTPDARRSLITEALKHPLPLPFGPLLPASPAPSASTDAGSGAVGAVGAIASAVPAVLTSTVPGVLASTVPQVLTSTVPSVLGSTLPQVLPSTVSQVVATTTTAVASPVVQVVASTVPQVVTSTAPSIVASTLPILGGVLGGATQTVGQVATPVTQVLSPLKPSPEPSSLLPLL